MNKVVRACAVASLLTLVSSAAFALPSVIVYISTMAPANAESTLLADTTGKWLGALVANPTYPGNYTFTLKGPNPAYAPPTCNSCCPVGPACDSCCPTCPPPVVDTTTLTLSQIATSLATTSNYLVWISSDAYFNGWANGMTYERLGDIGVINQFWNQCSSTSTFHVQGSTTTYDTHISSTTCVEVLNTLSNFIYNQFYADPTPIPNSNF